MIECRFEFRWNLFPGVQLTISQYGLGSGLAPNRRQATTWTNADPILWRIYAALGGDELKYLATVLLSHYASNIYPVLHNIKYLK